MKKGLAVFVALAFVFSTSYIFAAEKNATMFTNYAKTFKVPLNVSESFALLDYGEKAVDEFAKKLQKSGKWIYAFTAAVPIDPVTGQFAPNSTGRDMFVRFYNDKVARITINWKRLTAKSLDETINDYIQNVTSDGTSAKQVGDVIKTTIGGYPAMGAEFKISRGYFTVWFIKAKRVKREYSIGFAYEEGLQEPADFKKVREGIIFLASK